MPMTGSPLDTIWIDPKEARKEVFRWGITEDNQNHLGISPGFLAESAREFVHVRDDPFPRRIRILEATGALFAASRMR